MRTIRLDMSALEVNTFEVATKPKPEPPQKGVTRCTKCTLAQDCEWTAEA